MNLRALFHVSPASIAAASAAKKERMPSLVDVDVDYVDEPLPRGRSIETWKRARGWVSED